MVDNLSNVEKILQHLLDNLDEGIHIVDSGGRTIYYNKSMGRVEGINPEKVLGKKINEYLESVKENTSTLMRVLKTGDKIVDLIQHYSNENNKEVTTINTTIPVTVNGKNIAAIEIAKDMTQLKELTECIYKLKKNNKKVDNYFTFDDIYGTGEVMKNVIEKAKRASISNSPILIYAETGCGKEVFTQSIHYGGLRRNKPFIPVNCAAIPAPLLEGILFGTSKGSFTGAENKKGLFEEANRGTILLDEVNSMEPYLQSKLLRVLQDGYIRPIGSNRIIEVDVRVIATLNEEPEKLIEIGKLRKDFYYRLSVIRINIPPLRERKEDISMLVKKFIEYYNKNLGKNIQRLDEEVMEKLLEYNWPGNIRELKNVIESAMNMVNGDSILSRKHFESRIFNNCFEESNIDNINNLNIDENFDLEKYISNIESTIIKKVLNCNNHNISKASKQLNLSRQSLQYKIKKYSIRS
ncbi:arginine utilization regulatory protein [Clostridium tetanomorphum]|uniref:Sigma-54-dependent Fis family transcriptional regulator n=1 Tax=Clostridium tetanomorphum TaxID=1553 RepID=A0A923J288_CLOTT|nr:sigma-54-dependent Fis family transcriptional regulator [Clostridium tetanomorphum]KAJ49594.1 PAS modulated Fis family sigma-54-specific transcriptional regulator [Clostridium tetanomorphum DSM 665]KAJ50275.1 PAS modulated Fis family sigma-54-specific transcriptional regulator [Clostridium tetanomorphum DSM 665]MBC2400002.1 sigma-54-dependent Fis family transcriptional regulator [Clostridium tetanomorphum]MBP1864558.1 arginine utilization regulatory protein [Clostridium tetanomorphum]NRS829